MEFFFSLRFSSRKSQSRPKQAKKITHLRYSFLHFTNFDSRNILKNITFNTTKNLNYFTNMFLVDARKNFCTANFQTPKNFILEALGKKMSVCSVRTFLLQGRRKFLSGGEGGLSNCLKMTRYQGLVKCLKIFHFN